MFKRFSGTKVRKIYNIRKKKRKILANIEKKQYFCAAKVMGLFPVAVFPLNGNT